MSNTCEKNLLWSAIARHISLTVGEDQVIRSAVPICGGDINDSFRVTCGSKDYFVKLNKAIYYDMFEAESSALTYMSAFCPSVVCKGTFEDQAYLVLEFVKLIPSGNPNSLGELVAHLHQIHADDLHSYGWFTDNFIGLTPQKNRWHETWSDFWWDMRLLPQLHLAYDRGYRDTLNHQQVLKSAVQAILEHHKPKPSLLHGDLWSGNKAFLADGKAIIYDPAAYFGDKETDIAMTELFGGFQPEFYQTYYQIHPRDKGYDVRKNVYNLYHVLNHLNLFGQSYLAQTFRMIQAIIEDA